MAGLLLYAVRGSKNGIFHYMKTIGSIKSHHYRCESNMQSCKEYQRVYLSLLLSSLLYVSKWNGVSALQIFWGRTWKEREPKMVKRWWQMEKKEKEKKRKKKIWKKSKKGKNKWFPRVQLQVFRWKIYERKKKEILKRKRKREKNRRDVFLICWIGFGKREKKT